MQCYTWNVNGTNAITTSVPNAYNFAGPFTIAVWIKTTAVGGTYTSPLLMWCTSGGFAEGCKELLTVYSGTGQLNTQWYGGTGPVTYTGLNTGAWTFATLTYDGSGYLQWYLNGFVDSGGAFALPADVSGATLQINAGYVGQMNGLRIYNTVLTGAQIVQVCRATEGTLGVC